MIFGIRESVIDIENTFQMTPHLKRLMRQSFLSGSPMNPDRLRKPYQAKMMGAPPPKKPPPQLPPPRQKRSKRRIRSGKKWLPVRQFLYN